MKKTKILALVLVLMLTLSFTGCIGNFYENVGTVDGREIPAGLFLNLQYNAYTEGKALLEDSEADPFDQTIEGVKFKDWVDNRTDELVRQFVCVERMCAEREVVLGEESKSYIDQMTGYWDMVQDRYEQNGIGYDTLMLTMTNDMLTDELFANMYAEGGELAPSDEEMREIYEDSYAQLKYIMLPFSETAAEGEESVSHEDEVMAIAEEMQLRLEGGEDFEAVAEDGVEEVYTLLGREFTAESASGAISTNYVEYDGEGDEYYPAEFRAQLKEMETGDFGVHNMGSLIIVYEVVPNFEDDEAFTAARDTVIQSLYREDFDNYLAGIYADYPVTWNTGARWYFRPQKIVSA